MSAQRINGIKTHLERFSDAELESSMEFAHQRIDAATHDLELLGIESARRYALADMALQDTVEFPVVEDPNQGKLFHFPVPEGPQPPQAA